MRNFLAGLELSLAGAVVSLVISAAAPAAAAQDGSTFEHVHALAFDAAGRTLWLGAHAGLYRSEDGGATWTLVALTPPHHAPDVMAVAAHPKDPLVLYVGTHEAGILKSTDGGRSWSVTNGGLGGLDVHGLDVDPNAPEKLHAAVRGQGQGVYRTRDGGRAWVRVDDGPGGETKVLRSVNIPTGMGGIFLIAGTAAGLQRSADCF